MRVLLQCEEFPVYDGDVLTDKTELLVGAAYVEMTGEQIHVSESHPEELGAWYEPSIGLWVMNLPSIEVCNMSKLKAGWVGEYIGRRSSRRKESLLGNPFRITDRASREEFVKQYRQWLWQHIKAKEPGVCKELQRLLERYKSGEDLKLVCFCSPEACHGDVIKACLLWAASNDISFI